MIKVAYLIERITAISDLDLRGLFDDSLAKMQSGSYHFAMAETEEQMFQEIKQSIDKFLDSGMVLQVKKDSKIVFISCGSLNGLIWDSTIFLAGKDSGGSRAYLYDSDWILAMNEFHKTMASIYSEMRYPHIRNQSAVEHFDTMMATTVDDDRFGCSADDSNEDATYSKRNITGLS